MNNENKKTENMVAIATAEKAVAKTEKAAVKKAAPKAAKIDKIMSIAQVKSVARAAGITYARCKNTASTYVIFDGKTSLHVKKSGYRVYATNADFELIKQARLTNSNLIENGNAIDKCRPHTVDINSNSDLALILAAIAPNNKIELK